MQPPASVPVRYRYRLTRLGLHFLFVATFTMIGGALRGFNLLLVLSGILVGALLVQWRSASWLVQSTRVRRRLPPEAFAETRFAVRYSVNNTSRLLPVWMIRIDDRIVSVQSGESSAGSCGIGLVGPRQSLTAHYECVVSTRGTYRFGPLQLSTSFPFSLFLARRIVSEPEVLYVYPKLLRLRKGWQTSLKTKQGGVAAAARRSGPHEGDFFGLREWQTGDNPRWIHHRTTARVTEPIVRQFEQQRRFDACLLVDCYDGRGPRQEDELLETALSFAATMIAWMDGSPANQLVLAIAGKDSLALAGGRPGGGKRHLLRLLAEASPTAQPQIARTLERAVQVAGHAKDLVVISPRSLQDVMQADDVDSKQLGKTLQMWTRTGGFRWINVGGTEFRQGVLDSEPTPQSATRATDSSGQLDAGGAS